MIALAGFAPGPGGDIDRRSPGLQSVGAIDAGGAAFPDSRHNRV